MNRRVREPYARWCERLSPSVFTGGAVYSIGTSPFFSVVFVRVISCLFLVRWLGGSFAKLGFSVGLCGFANVPPKALAYYSIIVLK